MGTCLNLDLLFTAQNIDNRHNLRLLSMLKMADFAESQLAKTTTLASLQTNRLKGLRTMTSASSCHSVCEAIQ